MKVLGIHGSPRRGGNSDLLLDRVLEGAASAGAEIESVRAADLKMTGCQECGGCTRTGECVVKDDMQLVYGLLDRSERIVLAAPMFFYGLPAQLKALIDRAQARWSARMLNKTPEQRRQHQGGQGYLVAVGATRGRNLFCGVELTAKYFYDALDMDYAGGLFFRGVDDKGAIGEHPQALEQARRLGVELAGGT